MYPLRLETLVLILHWLGYDSSTYELIEKFIRLQYENLPNDPQIAEAWCNRSEEAKEQCRKEEEERQRIEA